MTNCVSSKVKINTPKLKQLDKASIRALEQTVEALHTEVVNAQVIPFDTGEMQNNSTFVDCSQSSKGVVSLITAIPYARRMYFHPEYNFQTKENPNAQGNWLDNWINGKDKDFCSKTFSKLYKKEAGL